MTVAEMSGRMTYAEFVEWQALDQIRADEREKARRLARKGMKGR